MWHSSWTGAASLLKMSVIRSARALLWKKCKIFTVLNICARRGNKAKVSQLMFPLWASCFERILAHLELMRWIWTAWYLLQVLACRLVAEGQKLWFTSSSNCSLNMEASAFVIFCLQVYSWELAFHSYFFGLVGNISRFSMYSRVVLALLPLPICM